MAATRAAGVLPRLPTAPPLLWPQLRASPRLTRMPKVPVLRMRLTRLPMVIRLFEYLFTGVVDTVPGLLQQRLLRFLLRLWVEIDIGLNVAVEKPACV
jgi:hypothetical protein